MELCFHQADGLPLVFQPMLQTIGPLPQGLFIGGQMVTDAKIPVEGDAQHLADGGHGIDGW